VSGAPAELQSWGGLEARDTVLIEPEDWLAGRRRDHSVLAYGNGRSYGDSCLNDGGGLIAARRLGRILSFDVETGIAVCEAGVLLDELLRLCVPAGWFPPVTPGTSLVTIAGALANDVHGKNHHRAGTFGRHVRSFDLARSDGSVLTCTPTENAELFAATIGGMGLTGLVTQVELQLMPVESAQMVQEVVHFDGLGGFFALAAESDATYDYTVAWVDSLAGGRDFGRGVFFRASHAPASEALPARAAPTLPFPVKPRFPLINRLSLRAFNAFYRAAQPRTPEPRRIAYQPFFYPLDRVRDWNRVYGPRGLRQFQCAVPMANAREAVEAMLRLTLKAGESSFLTVLKLFGNVPSPGMMSFPIPGATLTLDFPHRGERTLRLLDDLDRVAMQAGGRVNPYKDARMSAATFEASFPHWRDFACHVDPAFSSSFWRRVTSA
jgi:FAD/FMN-containing dehydrogenase